MLWSRKYLLLGAAVIGLCVGSFALGRYGTAERVVIQEKVNVVEVVHEVVVEKERVVEKKVYVADTKQRIHREETKTETPDGTVVTQKTEDLNIDSHVRDVEIREVEKQVVVEVEKRVEVEKEVFVDKSKPSPDWRISALAGTTVTDLQQWSVGVEVQRRILGPFSIGAWGLSSGQAGVSASIEF